MSDALVAGSAPAALAWTGAAGGVSGSAAVGGSAPSALGWAGAAGTVSGSAAIAGSSPAPGLWAGHGGLVFTSGPDVGVRVLWPPDTLTAALGGRAGLVLGQPPNPTAGLPGLPKGRW